MTPEPVDGVWEIDRDITRLCSIDGAGQFSCPSGRYCGGDPFKYGITLEQEDVQNEPEIFYGIVTFDNIGIGMITIF